MKKSLPRCVMTAKDGSQCSHRVSDGSAPPVCHIHRAKAAGTSVSPLTQPVELDELDIVKKLARSSDERIRLRAAELLIELKRRDEKPKETADYTRFLKALTPDESSRLGDLVAQLRAFKESVYDRLPNLRPAGDVEPVAATPRSQRPEPGETPPAPQPAAPPPDPNEVITVETLNHGPRDVTRKELEESTV